MSLADIELKEETHIGIKKAVALFEMISASGKLTGTQLKISSFINDNGGGMHVFNKKTKKGVHVSTDTLTGKNKLYLGDESSIPYPHTTPSNNLTPIEYTDRDLRDISAIAVDYLTS